MYNMNSYWLITPFRNLCLYSYMPEDDPEKGSKHVALPLTQIKTYVETVLSILFYCVSKRCCVDWPLIYNCRIHTQQVAYHKTCVWISQRRMNTRNMFKVKKGTAIPVTNRGGPLGCITSRLLHFLDNRLTDGGEVVSLTRRSHLYPQEDSWYSFLSEAESAPRP
jgi:hypothetical protein